MRAAEEAGEQGGGSLLPILLAALAAVAVSILALRGTGSRTAPAPTTPRARAGGNASPAPAPATAATEHSSTVVGYASAHDRDEVERQAATIERACRERAWTLACVIRENGSANGNGHKRPGLAHAAKQVRSGVGGRLVVDSIDHLGRSKEEVRAQLRWLAGDEIELVALNANGNGNAGAKRRRPRRTPA